MTIRFNTRERALTSVTLVVLMVAFYSFLEKPQRQKISRNQAEIARVEGVLTQKTVVLANLSDEVQRSISSLKEKTAPDVGVQSSHTFSRVLNALVESNDLGSFSVKSVRVVGQEDHSSYKKAKIEVLVESSYYDIGHFFEKLRESDSPLNVAGLRIFKVTDDLRRVEAYLELEGYVLR